MNSLLIAERLKLLEVTLLLFNKFSKGATLRILKVKNLRKTRDFKVRIMFD